MIVRESGLGAGVSMAEHPNLQRVVVADRGHAPLLTEPECIQSIEPFLQSLHPVSK